MNKKQTKYYLFLLALIWAQVSIAQEVLMPAGFSANLSKHIVAEKQVSNFKKSESLQAPIIDYFQNDGAPNMEIWSDSLTQISNRNLVLNNLDYNGNVYGVNLSDQLSSRSIDLSTTTDPLYFSFQLATGNTFVVGDSLVLEFLNKQQVWNKVWGSTIAITKFKEIVQAVDLNEYKSSNFQFRFSLYSKSNQASAQIYLMRQVVLATLNSIPFAIDNYNGFNKNEAFIGLDVSFSNNDNSPALGNGFVLDAYDFKNNAYANSNRSADTLAMHPISLLNYSPKDSVYLSFTVKTLSAWKSKDSLVFECKNNLGVWVPFLIFKNPSDSISTFNIPINFGRFRHAFFASRWCLKSVAEIQDTAKIFISSIQLYKKIQLPFLDDFSAVRRHVDAAKWQDNFVYVNNEFPENQPSINVATFDGLDSKGNAYSPYAIKGTADVLNTWTFDLSKSSVADSLYLSFYAQYELQGTSEQVFPDDSFVVEFRNTKYQKNSYAPLMSISAKDAVKHEFTRYDVLVKDSSCFHDKFEIRFRNRGSLTGNLSQWHLDYIYLNKGRTATDAINDVSLTNTPHPYLGLYYALPFNQYTAALSKYSVDTAQLRFMNHDKQSFVLDYSRTTYDADGNTIAQYQDFTNIEALSDTSVKFVKPIPFTSSSPDADSIVFQTRYKVGFSSPKNDLIASNDTLTIPVVFSNYMAYDDGSAEGGYGIKNKTNCGAALRFELSIPDTLYGVYLFFNQSEKNVANQKFGLRVWEQITEAGLPANDDKLLYKIDNLSPVYLNAINAYSYLKFDQPVPVKTSFYIGWEQAQSYVLNIGLDKNFPFGINPNLFYKQDGQWYPSAISGTPMMRPVIGKWIDVPAAIKEPIGALNNHFNCSIYPNPSNGLIHLQSNSKSQFTYEVYELSGRMLSKGFSNQNEINLNHLENGIYLIKLNNEENKQYKVSRIIIQK